VEIREAAFGVDVDKEVGPLGFRPLAVILERFQPRLAGFRQVETEHDRSVNGPALARPDRAARRPVREIPAQDRGHVPIEPTVAGPVDGPHPARPNHFPQFVPVG
jgi:hypothetical protein